MQVVVAESERSMSPEGFATEYLPKVLRYAQMAAPPGVDPEDLAQEAMIRAITRLPSFDPDRGSMEAWLWSIVLSRGRDAYRLVRRQVALLHRVALVNGHARSSEHPEALVIARIEDDQLLAFVRGLPARYRTVLALRYGADLSFNQIAAATKTTPMAAKKMTRRALDRLEADLRRQGRAE